MEFRINFIGKLAQNVIWMGFFVLMILVIYSNVESVAGWTRGDAYVLAATSFLLLSVVNMLFTFNLLEIPQKVRQGTLDFDLVKPLDTQFLVSVRKFNFDEIGTLFAGIGMAILGVSLSGHHPSGMEIIEYIFLLLCAMSIFYSFDLTLMTLAVWLVRVENLWALSDQILGLTRVPIDVYAPPWRRLLTFYIPLAFLASVPAKALIGEGNITLVLWGVVWALGSLIASRFFFLFAMKRYHSASS